MPSSLRRIKIFTSNKTLGLGDVEDATFIRKLFFASKVGRVDGINRAICQVDVDRGGSFVKSYQVLCSRGRTPNSPNSRAGLGGSSSRA
jgi:hypothetical protein